MSNMIKDGTGTPKLTKVGNRNRLHTHSLAASVANVASVRGEAFNVNTDLITLTSDSESGLLYIKNQENEDISIQSTLINIGESTGGSGDTLLTFYTNPTSGTLISGATDAVTVNLRIGDSETLDVLDYQGVEGSTVSGGGSFSIPLMIREYDAEVILPKGSSVAIAIQPPSGNTSMKIQVGFLVIKNYREYTVD